MGILILVFIIIVLVIILGELNPLLINLNLYGLVIKNIPLSVFIILFIVLGCLLGVLTMLGKYCYIKKQYLKLKEEMKKEQKEDK